ncbi:acyltransferase family protein [Thalassiella azotivora]
MSGTPVATGRFPVLDGLRAVGALAVLTTHVGFQSGAALNGPLAGPLARLDVGVALFFVVSGFLLYRPHVVAALDGTASEPWSRYLLKRALRILPAYWLALLLAAVVVPRDFPPPGREWVLHALLLQVYDGQPQILGLAQMWSLSTEVAFYLLLPLLVTVLLPGRRPGSRDRALLVTHGLLATTLVGGAVVHAVATVSGPSEWNLWLPSYVGWFAAGMLLAWWRESSYRGLLPATVVLDVARMPGYCYGAAALVYLLACTPVAGAYDLTPPTPFEAGTKTLLYTVVGALVVLPATIADGREPRTDGPVPLSTVVLSSRPARWLGDVSYGVFCYHLAVLFAVQRLLDHEVFSGDFWLLWVPTVAVSLLLAAASYRWVERPVMRWGSRRRSAPLTTTSASASATSS